MLSCDAPHLPPVVGQSLLLVVDNSYSLSDIYDADIVVVDGITPGGLIRVRNECGLPDPAVTALRFKGWRRHGIFDTRWCAYDIREGYPTWVTPVLHKDLVRLYSEKM